jgi:hypothetical protein
MIKVRQTRYVAVFREMLSRNDVYRMAATTHPDEAAPVCLSPTASHRGAKK